MNEIRREAKILIVDDNEETVLILEHILRKAGYQFVHRSLDSRLALPLIDKLQPDLLILDLFMPAPDGFEILDQLSLRLERDEFLQVLVLTADISAATKLKVLSMGAREFLTKPVDRVDLLIRVRNLLECRYLHKQLCVERAWRGRSETQARQQSSDVEAEVLDRLASVLACVDPERVRTGERIAALAGRIAAHMGMDAATVNRVVAAARIHDIGLLAIPEAIRNSARPLTQEEHRIMKRHALVGGEMLSGSSHAGIEMAREMILGHHERWDGAGYPFGLKKEAIPMAARIVAVAHVYDGLVNEKPYRPCVSPDEALAEINRQAGYAFDPDVVASLMALLDKTAAQSAGAELAAAIEQ